MFEGRSKRRLKRRKEEHVTRLTYSQLNHQWLQPDSRYYCHLPPPNLPQRGRSIPRPGLSGQVLLTYLPAQTVGWAGVGWEGHLPTDLPAYVPTYPWKIQPVLLLARLQLVFFFFFLGKNFWFVAKVAIIHRKMKK